MSRGTKINKINKHVDMFIRHSRIDWHSYCLLPVGYSVQIVAITVTLWGLFHLYVSISYFIYLFLQHHARPTIPNQPRGTSKLAFKTKSYKTLAWNTFTTLVTIWGLNICNFWNTLIWITSRFAPKWECLGDQNTPAAAIYQARTKNSPTASEQNPRPSGEWKIANEPNE